MSNISNILWPFSENGFIRSRPSFYGVHFVNCYLLADGWEGGNKSCNAEISDLTQQEITGVELYRDVILLGADSWQPWEIGGHLLPVWGSEKTISTLINGKYRQEFPKL